MNADLEKEGIAEVPVWIHFPNLKLHLWSITSLSKFTSVIGKPLFTDKITAERERITFARVCVEVKVGDPLPMYITTKRPDGRIIEQKVEYEWVPTPRTYCGVFGHVETR